MFRFCVGWRSARARVAESMARRGGACVEGGDVITSWEKLGSGAKEGQTRAGRTGQGGQHGSYLSISGTEFRWSGVGQ